MYVPQSKYCWKENSQPRSKHGCSIPMSLKTNSFNFAAAVAAPDLVLS